MNKIRNIFIMVLFIGTFFFSGALPPVFSETEPQAMGEPALYRGIYHVHTEFSPDSKASLKNIIETAQKLKLDFVVLTDHNNRRVKGAYEKMAEKPVSPLTANCANSFPSTNENCGPMIPDVVI